MFVIPLAFAVAQPCAEFVLAETAMHSIWMTTRLPAAAIGDVMFLASFVVLGGNFRNKIRSLFVYRATALIPQKDAESSS